MIPELIITKMAHEGDELRARVCVAGEVVPVRRRGGWQTLPDDEGRVRHLLPWVAARLQERARALERKERRDAA